MVRFKDWIWIVFGCILFAVGIDIFAKNAPFAPGGVSGLSLILNHLTAVPVGVLTLLLNIPIVIFCAKVLGKPFLKRSLLTMLISVIFLDIVFPLFPFYQGEPILSAIFAGVFMGGGLGTVYLHGSSTGGTDFIIVALKKAFPRFSMGQITLLLDGIVIALGGLVFQDWSAMLYGMICTYTASVMIDKLLYGAGGGKMNLIITSAGMEAAGEISRRVGRGSTLLSGVGTYQGDPRQVLLCICSRQEILGVRNAVFSVDPKAFVAVSDVSEVMGLGFSDPGD